MYHSYDEYLEWLTTLLTQYGISKDDLNALTLVGYTVHAMSDINETVQNVSRSAIKESHVMTAERLDSLYKHAREVDLFPSLSKPAEMDFVLIINEDDFIRVAEPDINDVDTQRYVISKSNYITVGDFIYSLDRDILITRRGNVTIDGSDINDPSNRHKVRTIITAEYADDDEVPSFVSSSAPKVIKTIRRLSIGNKWELHLYMRLKQYAREIQEREFGDRDYAIMSYTTSAELVGIDSWWHATTPSTYGVDVFKLKPKLYFETSETLEKSIYMNFESPNTFTLIHKSQLSGFRPKINDKLVTYIYTTTGKNANFRYSRRVGDDISWHPDRDTDLTVRVFLIDGVSSGGVSFVNDKEALRRDIITKKSTRGAITTENDLLMTINQTTRTNDHVVVKVRDDIKRIFNVFSTLKYKQNNKSYYIPTNTLDVVWDLSKLSNGKGMRLADIHTKKFSEVHANSRLFSGTVSSPNVSTIAAGGSDGYDREWYINLNSFIVKQSPNEPNMGELILGDEHTLISALMEEYRMGLQTPKFTTEGALDLSFLGEDYIYPTITVSTSKLVKGKVYYYKNRLYTCLKDKNDLSSNQAIAFIEYNTARLTKLNDLGGVESSAHTGLSDDIVFRMDDNIYYYLPYFISYEYSTKKNFVRLYEQNVDNKIILDYDEVNNNTYTYSFICNWVEFSKPSILNEYTVSMNVMNTLAGENSTMLDLGLLKEDAIGKVIDLNRLQCYLKLYTKDNNGDLTEVYINKFRINEYNSIPSDNTDYINYTCTLLPAGFLPKIVDNHIMLYSEIIGDYVWVPLTNLVARIEIYVIPAQQKYIEKTVEFTIPNSKEPFSYNIYKNLTKSNYTQDEISRFRINKFDTEVSLFREVTDLFKIQHTITKADMVGATDKKALVPKVIKLKQVPLVGYTFYKYFSYLYHTALKEEYSILNNRERLQGEYSLSLKYTRTYGPSSYYKVGKFKNHSLNNLQLDLSIIIKSKLRSLQLPLNDISNTIAEYIDAIDFDKHDNLHISRLYDHLFNIYGDMLDYLEFNKMNGIEKDNQLITLDNEVYVYKDPNYIVEKINIPYTYNGDFKYVVNWEEVKMDGDV